MSKILERVWFRYPDTVVGSEPLIRQILTDVTKLSFRFYSNKKWQEAWAEASDLPEGIMVQMTLEDFGEIERVYMLPTSALSADDKESS